MSTVVPKPRLLAVAVGATLLAGCAVTAEYRAPAPTLPAAWTQGETKDAPAQAAIDAAWWRAFADPLLAQLVERALQANADVKIAQARLRSARAASAIAGAALQPSVSATAAVSRSASGDADARSTYRIGFDAGWEIDIFGGRRRQVEAAVADEQAAGASLAATQVSLAADVARNYVEIRALQVRLVIARANVASQGETLQLTEWRAAAGLVSALDVEQGRANREQTRAQIPALESALAQGRHRLAVLLGESPTALDAQLAAGETPAVPRAPENVALGIPADVLRQRPDVVAAERSLAAATARVGVAEAARYPSFALSGSVGLEALTIDALAGSGALTRSIVGRLAAPIFDAGRLRLQVEVQSAAQALALASYEATLLAAIEDVENALVALANGRLRAGALGQALAAARNARLMAQQRYRSGLTDFQTVLDAERTVRAIEDSVAVTDADNVSALIQLYKALGGGWTAAAMPVAASAVSRP